MKPIPAEIKFRYDDALVEKGVPPAAHSEYRKWLMYYLDFCAKYHHEESNRESLSRFIEKLKEKKQVEEKRKQASQSVAIFCELENRHHDAISGLKNKKENISTKKDELKSMGADWSSLYSNLNAEIKLRHYSQKTLKSYRGWIRKLQDFTKSKDPRLLSTSDVKDFLTHL